MGFGKNFNILGTFVAAGVIAIGGLSLLINKSNTSTPSTKDDCQCQATIELIRALAEDPKYGFSHEGKSLTNYDITGYHSIEISTEDNGILTFEKDNKKIQVNLDGTKSIIDELEPTNGKVNEHKINQGKEVGKYTARLYNTINQQ